MDTGNSADLSLTSLPSSAKRLNLLDTHISDSATTTTVTTADQGSICRGLGGFNPPLVEDDPHTAD